MHGFVLPARKSQYINVPVLWLCQILSAQKSLYCKMPHEWCAVLGCKNSTKDIQEWRKKDCPVHNSKQGQGDCICHPPFRMRRFPKDPELKGLWEQAVNKLDKKTGNTWYPKRNSRICSSHFERDGEIPSLNLGHSDTIPPIRQARREIGPVCSMEETPVRRKREVIVLLPPPVSECDSYVESFADLESRSSVPSTSSLEQNDIVLESPQTECSEQDIADNLEEYTLDTTCKFPETSDVTADQCCIMDHSYAMSKESENCGSCLAYRKCIDEILIEINSEEEENKRLRAKVRLSQPRGSIQHVQKSMCEKLLKTDKKVKFYTGLRTKNLFQLVFKMMEPKVEKMTYWCGAKRSSLISTKVRRNHLSTPKKPGPKRKLSAEDELLLTLIKLRLALTNEDLADRFGISTSGVSVIFNTWIKALADAFRGLISYPTKEIIESNLPDAFRKDFPRLRCILDCSEFFIDRPRDLELQALTWSEYKHHNTIKILVGITPYGSISFLSKAWGGRTTDNTIVKESGFLNLVDPKDQFLADKGFTLKAELMERGAELVIPPGARGNEQMTAEDVKKTKKVANARIYVEMAIGRLKLYRILTHQLPVHLVPLIDDIITVCAAFCNLLQALVE